MHASPETDTLYRATIEYDGTDLLGFQIQAEGRTVQGEIEQALAQLTQRFVRVHGAGRTDSGVHAVGQVISFRIRWRRSRDHLKRGLNALLPSDIAVRELSNAPQHFHPRFSAESRWYRYQIGEWSDPSPLRDRYAWRLGPDLDLSAMQRATSFLVGEHDFASFGQPPEGDVTIRRVFKATWHRQAPYLFFDITANAFLRRMVRKLVATFILVGQGKMQADDIPAILDQKDLSSTAAPAPPQGLILMAVTYPNDSMIASENEL